MHLTSCRKALFVIGVVHFPYGRGSFEFGHGSLIGKYLSIHRGLQIPRFFICRRPFNKRACLWFTKLLQRRRKNLPRQYFVEEFVRNLVRPRVFGPRRLGLLPKALVFLIGFRLAASESHIWNNTILRQPIDNILTPSTAWIRIADH